ncbi:MAG: hypothetical protein HZA61_02915, partial [Candidatus Eisenbacteria bacterium]|nr:hypothetical protein [Candidatus Eisenbacteria bacterium]
MRRSQFPVLAFALLTLLALVPLTAHEATAATYWSTDFESGVPAEMTTLGSAIEGTQGWGSLGHPGNTYGAHFLRYSAIALHDTKLVLRGLPAHTHVSVGFLLALIDSWDGTELYQVTVDGNLRFDHWFQLATGDTTDYAAAPGTILSMGRELGFSGGSYYARDRAYDLGLDPAFQDIPHTADSLVVVWKLSAVSGGAAQQWQGGGDESWAIDNVRVSLRLAGTGVDESANAGALALAIAGAQPSVTRDVHVSFTLPQVGGARLDLFDATGRRLAGADAGALGAGRHTLALGEGRLEPGLYWVRLTQNGATRTAKAV